ncbi:MAG: hypothetical protein WCJ35_18440 [Planctomycetota bacterium]
MAFLLDTAYIQVDTSGIDAAQQALDMLIATMGQFAGSVSYTSTDLSEVMAQLALVNQGIERIESALRQLQGSTY